MNEVTRILSAIEHGDPLASEQLLPLLYEELRKRAAQALGREKPGQTLQATALVHEAYLRLVASPGRESGSAAQQWNSRGHFFAAAAEAMRRILVERARHKKAERFGGGRERVALHTVDPAADGDDERLLALNDALDKLAAEDLRAAEVVKLRHFAGLTIKETAAALGICDQTVNRDWEFAKAMLFHQLSAENEKAD